MRYITLAIALLICTAAEAQVIRAEPFYTAPEAGVTNLLLDDYSGAAVAYSLRKLDKDYTGSAIRVRRKSDNSEQDIGFVNNYLDTASLKTFAGTGATDTAWVVRWYNQADSSGVFGIKNISQSTASNQPLILTSGSIRYLNNSVTLLFAGTPNKFLSGTVPYSLSQQYVNAFSVFSYISGAGNYIIGAGSDNGFLALVPFGAWRFLTIRSGGTSGGNGTNSASSGVMYLRSDFANRSNLYSYRNGSLNLSMTDNNSNFTSGGFGIGTSYSGTNFTSNELILYTVDQSSNRTAIETNINSFYSIY